MQSGAHERLTERAVSLFRNRGSQPRPWCSAPAALPSASLLISMLLSVTGAAMSELGDTLPKNGGSAAESIHGLPINGLPRGRQGSIGRGNKGRLVNGRMRNVLTLGL